MDGRLFGSYRSTVSPRPFVIVLEMPVHRRVMELANATARVVRQGHGELRAFVLGADMSDQWGYTVDEVAAILKVSKHTVLRRARELGAVQIAGNEGSIKVRRYRVLRFPRVALEKYLTKLTGHPVVLSSLTITQTRRARADWEETATRKLAEVARANSKGVPERAVFARIARNARTLCFVDREEWKDVEFVEGED